jgi:hypothetical protein
MRAFVTYQGVFSEMRPRTNSPTSAKSICLADAIRKFFNIRLETKRIVLVALWDEVFRTVV